MKKTLIEESTVELLEYFDRISQEARKEKLAVPPCNLMVYYWTRKPLIVGRAVTLTSTLNNIDDVKNLTGLGKDSRAYKFTPNVATYKKNLGRNPSEIKVLDPFAGSGNLLFEAKRLGLDCTAADYNPLAYLLEKSIHEYSPRYGTRLVEDFVKYAQQVVDMTKKELGKFYKENDLVYFWIYCIKCPHCDQRTPLSNQMWIANSKKNKIGIRFKITDNNNFTVELVQNMSEQEGKQYTQKGGKAICISCKNSIDYDTMTSDISLRRDIEMTVKQVSTNKGRKYVLATKDDKKLFHDAVEFYESKSDEYSKKNFVPSENILAGYRREHMLWAYGIKYWRDYFMKRQLLLLTTLLKNIKNVCKNIDNKELAKTMSLFLGFMLCRHVNSNSLGVLWHASFEKPAHTLTVRQPSFIFNHVEVNPFVEVSGALKNVITNIRKAIDFSSKNQGISVIKNKSVNNIPISSKYDLIITDPPYLDDVIYGEFSEFMYIWLHRCVHEYFPELPQRAPLDEDYCQSWGRFGTKQLAFDFFSNGLKKSFVSMNSLLKDDGLLVVFFAHSSIEGWNLLLSSLRNAKFRVISSYAIHTENTSNVISRQKTSFMSSIVVVCRKLEKESTTFFEDVIPQTEDSIKSMINNIPLEKLLVLPITDLLIMVYGKVLEVCTQFTELKSYEKDFTPDFETLIKGSQSFIMKSIITKLTERSLNTLGSLTAFYLITKIFYRGILSSDDALKIERAYAINVGLLERNNVGKKEKNTIRLFYLHENELDLNVEEIDRNNLHQQLCYLVQVSKKQGAARIKSIITGDYKNFRVDDLKQIISLLINSLKLRINKNEKISNEEKEELRLLQAIADVMGIKTSTEKKGGMDEFL